MKSPNQQSNQPSNGGNPVLLFDGVCNLCNSSVQRVINADKKGLFRFASLQSEAATQILKGSAVNQADMKSVILFHNNKYYTRSNAVLESARLMGGAWSLLYVFKILPRFLRDALYNWVAKNRYKWFGKKDQCMLPTPELKERFL